MKVANKSRYFLIISFCNHVILNGLFILTNLNEFLWVTWSLRLKLKHEKGKKNLNLLRYETFKVLNTKALPKMKTLVQNMFFKNYPKTFSHLFS